MFCAAYSQNGRGQRTLPCLQLFSFAYPKSKEQVNGNSSHTAHSKPKQTLPSQFAKVRLCSRDKSLLHTNTRAHAHTYPFPGVFERLHLSFHLPNLIQVPPPGAKDMTCVCVTEDPAIPAYASSWATAQSFAQKTHTHTKQCLNLRVSQPN